MSLNNIRATVGQRYLQAYSLRTHKSDPPIHAAYEDSRLNNAKSICGVTELLLLTEGFKNRPLEWSPDLAYACGNCLRVYERR